MALFRKNKKTIPALRSTNTRHEQVTVEYNGCTIQVDKKMAPLLVLMWSRGIDTEYSCQGDTNLFVDQNCYEADRYRAYIQMPRTSTSMNFIGELVYNSHLLREESVSWLIEYNENPVTKTQRIVIRFPSSDIHKLMDTIEGWN